MSVRSEKQVAPINASEQMALAISDAQPSDSALHEGATYSTSTAENPLSRTVVVSVRASLNDLCLQKAKSTWAPSTEALRSILQQKVRCSCLTLPRSALTLARASQKYTGLDGSADAQGDLKERGNSALTRPLHGCCIP